MAHRSDLPKSGDNTQAQSGRSGRARLSGTGENVCSDCKGSGRLNAGAMSNLRRHRQDRRGHRRRLRSNLMAPSTF